MFFFEYQLALTDFEPHLGHSILLCSLPQLIHENLKGLYKELFIFLPDSRPDASEEFDLYQLFIPPIPAFFKAISALMILKEMMANSEAIKEMGKGKVRVKMTTAAKVINIHARLLFETSLSFLSALLISYYRHDGI